MNNLRHRDHVVAAGVKPNDELLALNAAALSDPIEFDRRLAAVRGGDEVRLTIRRSGQTIPITVRLPSLPYEQLPGVQVVYTHIRNPRGPRQRAILTRPGGTSTRLPAVLFVPWLTCDSIESPRSPAPGR